MAKVCCVKGCTIDNDGLHYFKFPTSKTLLSKWLKVVTTTCKVTVHSMICSQHFMEDDYENVRGKVRLKGQVVPSRCTGRETDQAKEEGTEERKRKSVDIKENGSNKEKDAIDNSRVNHANIKGESCDTEGGDNVNKNKVKNDVKNNRFVISKKKNRRDSLDSLEELNRHMNQNKRYACRDSPIDTSCQTQQSKMLEADKQDIEDILIHYQIQQNHKLKSEDTPAAVDSGRDDQETEKEMMEVELIPLPRPQSKEPVFIEISVDQNSRGDGDVDYKDDCLMVLENVQVDIDPSSLMLPERDPEEIELEIKDEVRKNSPAPISLLTSSDESDVIIEEPLIDVVEVSDEDEDDLPLCQLFGKQRGAKIQLPGDYYCASCKYKADSLSDYHRHLSQLLHGTAVQICDMCGYTTATRTQYLRHRRRHNDERNHKCHICDYKARHKMSLVYHLKSHGVNDALQRNKRFNCEDCFYGTDRKGDYLRHKRRRHTK